MWVKGKLGALALIGVEELERDQSVRGPLDGGHLLWVRLPVHRPIYCWCTWASV